MPVSELSETPGRQLLFHSRDSGGRGFWRHYLWFPDGKRAVSVADPILITSETDVKELVAPLPPKNDIRPYDPKLLKRPMPRKPCQSCGHKGAQMMFWLKIRWIGIPAPVRWWKDLLWSWGLIRYPWGPKDFAGCGCIYRLKRTYETWRTI